MRTHEHMHHTLACCISRGVMPNQRAPGPVFDTIRAPVEANSTASPHTPGDVAARAPFVCRGTGWRGGCAASVRGAGFQDAGAITDAGRGSPHTHGPHRTRAPRAPSLPLFHP